MIATGGNGIFRGAIGAHPFSKRILLPLEAAVSRLLVGELRFDCHGYRLPYVSMSSSSLDEPARQAPMG
jgi:hypothetical protein